MKNTNNSGEEHQFLSANRCSFNHRLQKVYNGSSLICCRKLFSTQGSMSTASCSVTSRRGEGCVFLAFFFFILFCTRGRQECCAVLCAQRLPVLRLWHLMLEGRVGVVLAGAQAGQTSPQGPSGEMNERNGNAAKYQVCFLLICEYMLICMCVCVSDRWAVVRGVQVRCEAGVEDRHDNQTSLSVTVFY